VQLVLKELQLQVLKDLKVVQDLQVQVLDLQVLKVLKVVQVLKVLQED
jgi:hypothetical protein